jgi:hypothetical protein
MKRTRVAITMMLLLAACAGSSEVYEGSYEPGCVAFEGDRIELRAGRFQWRRFTDQINVDADGNIVNPFPGFPRAGDYRHGTGSSTGNGAGDNAGPLQLTSDDGSGVYEWYPFRRAGENYLLTPQQNAAFLASGDLPDCALKAIEAQN